MLKLGAWEDRPTPGRSSLPSLRGSRRGVSGRQPGPRPGKPKGPFLGGKGGGGGRAAAWGSFVAVSLQWEEKKLIIYFLLRQSRESRFPSHEIWRPEKIPRAHLREQGSNDPAALLRPPCPPLFLPHHTGTAQKNAAEGDRLTSLLLPSFHL